MNIRRGEILLIEFDPTRGSEIKKTRPAVIITNDIANTYSRLLMAVPITSQKLDKIFPHEVLLNNAKGLNKPSKANISQMRAIDRSRIKSKLGKVSLQSMREIEVAMKLHLGLT